MPPVTMPEVPNQIRYTIIETSMGPMISESRVSVFDVMEAHDAGDSIYEIALTFNLSPLQVETAVVYISQHHDELEPQLAEIKQALVAREAYYRDRANQIDRRVAALPMTPERAALHVLRERVENGYRSWRPTPLPSWLNNRRPERWTSDKRQKAEKRSN